MLALSRRHKVNVNGKVLEAHTRIFINTGGRAAIPPIPWTRNGSLSDQPAA